MLIRDCVRSSPVRIVPCLLVGYSIPVTLMFPRHRRLRECLEWCKGAVWLARVLQGSRSCASPSWSRRLRLALMTTRKQAHESQSMTEVTCMYINLGVLRKTLTFSGGGAVDVSLTSAYVLAVYSARLISLCSAARLVKEKLD